MTATVLCTAAPTSDEWLMWRPSGIGASEVATVLGYNPYATPLDLYLAKTGQAEPFTGNYATRRGQHLEAFILSTFADEHPGMVVESWPDIPSMLAHPDVPALRASLDGLCHDKSTTAVVEIKSGSARQRGAWGDDTMPDAYLVQAQAQLAVTGLDVAYVAADIGGDYIERVVPRDDAFIDSMVQMVDHFWWNHCDPNGPRVMPDPDLVRDRDTLPRLWTADVTAEPVVLGADAIDRLRAAKAALNAAKTDYEVAAAEIQAQMRESVAAVDAAGDPVASWSPVKARESIDVKRLRAQYPAIAADLTMTGQPGRSFRVKS